MAGNATTRGVPRQLLQGSSPSVPVIGASQLPQIQFSSGNARALQQFSREMFSFANEQQDQLDAQASAEASNAGAKDGATGDYAVQDYGTIRGRAYNKAALETFAANVDTAGAVKLNQLQQQYYNDPDQIEQKMKEWTDGYSQELEGKDPAAAALFRNRQTIRTMPAVEQARDTAYKLTRDEADAANIENEAAMRAEIKGYAGDLFSENPERSGAAAKAVGMLQADYMRTYTAVDPTTGKPLYSPTEIAKAKKGFVDMTMSSASLAWFDEQPDKAGAYLKFTQGDFAIKLKENLGSAKIVMANAGKRRLPLQEKLSSQLQAAASSLGPGYDVQVISGGQVTKAEAAAGLGQRTGSERHDHGGAGDVRIMFNGKPVTPAENRKLYLQFAENAAAAGVTGIGIDEGGQYIHLGGGPKSAWGYGKEGGRSKYLPDDFKAAVERGWMGEPLGTKPSEVDVKVRETLSAQALDGIETEMRQRMVFRNQMADRTAQQEAKRVEAIQEKNAADLMFRSFGVGAKDPDTGETIAPPTRENVIQAERMGLIKPNDGIAIMKAITTERPEVSDEPTKRDFMRRVYNNEDIYSDVIAAQDKLSTKDVADLLGKNQSLVRGRLGEFNEDQKFQYGLLEDRLGGKGLFDKFDQGKADRAAMAKDEFRRRVMDPENKETPAQIVEDIANRAISDMGSLDTSALGRMVPPRFSVAKPDRPGRLDVKQSAMALQAAKTAGTLTESQFNAEVARLKAWDEKQKLVEQQEAAKPKKAK